MVAELNGYASKPAIQQRVWGYLIQVTRPDSRLHCDFTKFNADYEGLEVGAQCIRALPVWLVSNLLFIIPDFNFEVLRRMAMEDGKRFVMNTYGITRSFLYTDPTLMAADCYSGTATLDGIDWFCQHMGLVDLNRLGRFDLLVTDTAAVSTFGIALARETTTSTSSGLCSRRQTAWLINPCCIHCPGQLVSWS